MAHDDLVQRLTEVLDVEDVRGLVRLSGGASRETWAFETIGEDARVEELILQRQRAGSDRDMELEARVLRAAFRNGVPVPEVVASSADPSVLGAPFMIVRRVRGETIARKIIRDDAFIAARPLFAAQCGDAIARLHAISPDSVAGLESTDQVTFYRAALDEFGEPHPAFELGFRWLEANRPAPTRSAIVHGDFRLGNVIVGPDGLRAVIDWELVHLGDPMEDLGWLCVKAWRFGAPRPVGGMGSYEDLFEAYGATAGMAVDPSVVRWWEALGTLKWGIMCMMQANVHFSGASRSHELAAIGRRVCENEHDLLLLLP